MPEDPQIFRHCKFRIIFPLLMRTAHAARMPDHELWTGFLRDPDGNLVGLMEEKR